MKGTRKRQELRTTEEWEDWYLAVLVKVANETGNSFGLTLAIGGMLVSGDVISPEAFFDGTHVPGEIKKELTRGSGEKARLPAYVHLKNACFYQAGGAAPPIPGDHPAAASAFFRAKLSSVDGFAPYTLQAVTKAT